MLLTNHCPAQHSSVERITNHFIIAWIFQKRKEKRKQPLASAKTTHKIEHTKPQSLRCNHKNKEQIYH